MTANELLAQIVAADGDVRYLRDIGKLQSPAVQIRGERIKYSGAAFSALQKRGLVGIHRDDTGFNAPSNQRIYLTRAGIEANTEWILNRYADHKAGS